MESKKQKTALMTLALYGMMILSLLVLVASGSRLYASLTNHRAQNEARRAVLSALVNCVQDADADSAVSLRSGPEGTALFLARGNTDYETRIYLADGRLVQQLCARNADYDPENADLLAQTGRFEVSAVGPNLLCFVTDQGTAYASLHCKGGEGIA